MEAVFLPAPTQSHHPENEVDPRHTSGSSRASAPICAAAATSTWRIFGSSASAAATSRQARTCAAGERRAPSRGVVEFDFPFRSENTVPSPSRARNAPSARYAAAARVSAELSAAAPRSAPTFRGTPRPRGWSGDHGDGPCALRALAETASRGSRRRQTSRRLCRRNRGPRTVAYALFGSGRYLVNPLFEPICRQRLCFGGKLRFVKTDDF